MIWSAFWGAFLGIMIGPTPLIAWFVITEHRETKRRART